MVAPLSTWLGKKLGGTGTVERVRYAIAYSYIPTVYSLVLVWLPSFLIFKDRMFTSEMPSLESISVLWVFLIVFGLIQLVIGVWSIFIS